MKEDIGQLGLAKEGEEYVILSERPTMETDDLVLKNRGPVFFRESDLSRLKIKFSFTTLALEVNHGLAFCHGDILRY